MGIRESKINVRGKDSNAIQRRLFSMGCLWMGDVVPKIYNRQCTSIYVNHKKEITSMIDVNDDYFNKKPYKEVKMTLIREF